MKIAIIDYGSGNLRSAEKAFQRALRESDLQGEIKVSNDADYVISADRVVLPGVGAFADCRAGLNQVDGMIDALNEVIIEKGRPFLGICVGTQLLADRGLEKSTTPGLGWIAGDVVEISPNEPNLKIPQIGWNTINVNKSHPILCDIPTGTDGWHAYFVHSYHFHTIDNDQLIATTDYGGQVTAIVGRDNIVGTQFHPEKSQKLGLALISNFLKWKP